LPSVLAGSTYPNLDFFDTSSVVVNDLRIGFAYTLARPTAPQYVYIYYYNDGNSPLNATVNFTHDALMSLWMAPGMSGYNLGTRTVTYNLGILSPGQSGTLICSFTIPSSTSSGVPYTHSAEILPITGDATPTNNVISYTDVVVTSYDPNSKAVLPNGQLDPGVDSILTYRIDFQNTGNDTAFTVEIRDTLDQGLDPLSIEVLGASHAYTWDTDYPGYLTFTFDNIMLPDSIINEPASHGFIMYRLKVKDNLPLGTQIRNKAGIYFDYNAPIITNTTLNTFGVVAIDPGFGRASGVSMYPNPAHDRVQLELADTWEGETEIGLMDLSGRLLLHTTMLPESSRSETLDVSALPKGVYLVSCRNANQQEVKKLVLQ